MVEMAIGNCDRLVRLVNDILDFDSVERGRLSLHREAIEAIDMLRRAADVAHTCACQVHINFRIDAAPALVLADPERILQVLNELVSNAIKFSPPDTQIRLVAQPFITPPASRTPAATGFGWGLSSSTQTNFDPPVFDPAGCSEVCFMVEDQGRGIAPEKLEKIFERFQQGDASDSRALGGTGLGLALCRSIVEQHGGRIWAESTPSQGSRFLFTLPAATPYER
jgi:signal transduction histidine kinase